MLDHYDNYDTAIADVCEFAWIIKETNVLWQNGLLYCKKVYTE